MLNVKLKFLQDEINYRRKVAAAYVEGINNSSITLPISDSTLNIQKYTNHVWHLFVVRCKRRRELQKHLAEHGIHTLIHYPIPPHRQRAYKKLNKRCYPISEKIHEEVISLPMGPTITSEQVKEVIIACNSFNAG